MKTQATMHGEQLEKFARFLDVHPGFYPELEEESAMVTGFHVGGCFLTIADMDRFISSQPHLALRETALFGPGVLGLAEAPPRKLLQPAALPQVRVR
jgi:hypothetical protein